MSLAGWETSNRLQFTIPTSRVGDSTEVVPVLFRLSSNSGFSKTDICYIFNYMSVAGSSYANRKKVAFSQLVDGEEVQLFAELDMWDHVTEKAVFWIRPVEISSEYLNVFYFYYDREKEANVNYVSEAGDLSVYPFIPVGADASYDIYGGRPMGLIKKDDKYLFWFLATTPVGGYWHGIVYYCESYDLTTFTNFTICVDDIPTATRLYKTPGIVLWHDGIFKMWYTGNNTNSTVYHLMYYCESLDGITWTNFIECQGLTISGLYGTQNGKKSPTVIVEGGLYKMWFTGLGNSNTYYYSIYYAESYDGVNWFNLQFLFSEHSVTFPTSLSLTSTESNRVYFKNGIYYLWIYAAYSGGGTMFYSKSADGKTFTTFTLFSEFNIQGTYDLTRIEGLFVYEEFHNLYTLLYCGYSDSNYHILRCDSVFIESPQLPSQYVWKDKFSAVHHFNPSFGYVNSTEVNAPVVSLNNVSITSDNLGSYAIKFNSTTSYANLGNNTRYDFGSTNQVLIFGTIESGNIIFTKGLYSSCTTSLYYQETPLLTRDSPDGFSDTFSGTVGNPLDPYLWIEFVGGASLAGDKFKFDDLLDSRIRSTFYIGGNFDVSFDFNIDNANLTDTWRFAVRLPFEDASRDYLFSLSYANGAQNMYIQQVQPDTYSATWGANVTAMAGVSYTSGSLRIYRIGSIFYFTYFYNGSWRNAYQVSSADLIVTKFEIDTTQSSTLGLSSFYVSNFYSKYDNSFFRRLSKYNDVLALDYRYNEQSSTLNLFDYTLTPAWKSYTFGVSSEMLDFNTCLSDSDIATFYRKSQGVQVNTVSVILGDAQTGITGKISEIFFFKHISSDDTMQFMTASLRDSLVDISLHFVRGYTTMYNKAISAKVLVYDQDSGDLLGSMATDPLNGFYYLEVPFRSHYFILGVGDSLHNDFILSNITPQLIL